MLLFPFFKALGCQEIIGMESGAISNGQISGSSGLTGFFFFSVFSTKCAIGSTERRIAILLQIRNSAPAVSKPTKFKQVTNNSAHFFPVVDKNYILFSQLFPKQVLFNQIA